MKYFYLTIVALLFIGCGGSQQPQPISYPTWYLNPPAHNGSSLYGVGDGTDINSAKNSALNAIAASLSVTLSSEFKKSESSKNINGNENTYKSVQNTIKTQVKEIEFSSYQVIQNQVTQNKVLVLVEVSRALLLQKQKEKLDRYSKELNDENKNISKQAVFKQSFLYSKQFSKAQRLKSLALLCKTIDSNFNPKTSLQQVANIQTAHNVAINKTKVSISASTEAKVFVDILKEGLNKAGIRTVTSKANTHIHLKNSFQLDEIYGFKIAKATLSISSKDRAEKTIATASLKFSGKSRYDYKKAKANSASILDKKIKKEGIYTLLGIQ